MEEKKAAGKKQLAVIGAVVAAVAAIIIGMAVYQKSPAQQIPKLLDLGQKYLLDEDYEQAIAKFDEVLAIDPKNINAYMGKAEAYIGLEDYASATDMYEEVIAIDPSYEDAYLKAADVHITTVEYSNAIDVLSRGYDATQSVTIQAKMEEVEALIAEQEEKVEETADADMEDIEEEETEAESETAEEETEDVEEEESKAESETAEETENDAGEENSEGNEHSDVADKASESKAEEKKTETQQEEVAVVANTQTNETATSSDYATAEVRGSNNDEVMLIERQQIINLALSNGWDVQYDGYNALADVYDWEYFLVNTKWTMHVYGEAKSLNGIYQGIYNCTWQSRETGDYGWDSNASIERFCNYIRQYTN